jgi:chemotaxis protein MotB
MAKKVKKEAPKPSAPAWMATFSDLMALLLTFFVLLFSFSTMDAAKWASIVSAFTGSYSIFDGAGLLPAPDLSALRSDPRDIYLPSDVTEGAESIEADDPWDMLLNELGLFALEAGGISQVSVTGDQQFITLRLEDALLFVSGMAELRNDSIPMLGRLWDVVSSSLHIIGEMRVEGHTCDLPLSPRSAFRDNWDLSQARANVVGRHFLSLGMDPRKLEMVGRSEFHPIELNDSLEGRAANRRVDIVLVRDITRRPAHHVDEIAPLWPSVP